MAATADDPRPSEENSGLDAGKASRSLWHGLISLTILGALVAGLLLAVPGLHGVAEEVRHMQVSWLVVGFALEILS